MTEDERAATGKNKTEYINEKIQEKGYKNKTYSADGEIYTDLPDTVKSVIAQGLKVGDEVVGYNTYLNAKSEDEKSYFVDGYASITNETQTIKTNTDMTWRYVGMTEDGKLEIIPDIPTGTISNDYLIELTNSYWYNSCIPAFKESCTKLYGTTKGTARSITIEDMLSILKYNGPKYFGFNNGRSETPLSIAEIRSEYGYGYGYVDSDQDKMDYVYIDNAYITSEVGRKIIHSGGSYYVASDAYKLDRVNEHEVRYYRVIYASFGYIESQETRYLDINYDGNSWDNVSTSPDIECSYSLSIRPIVTLNSDVTLTKSTTAANTWNM